MNDVTYKIKDISDVSDLIRRIRRRCDVKVITLQLRYQSNRFWSTMVLLMNTRYPRFQTCLCYLSGIYTFTRDPIRHHRGIVDCLSMFVIAMGAWCFVCQKPNRLRAAAAQSGSGTHGRYHSDRGTGEKKTMVAYPHIQRSTYAHVVVVFFVILDLYNSLSHILLSCCIGVEEPYYYPRASKVSLKFIG